MNLAPPIESILTQNTEPDPFVSATSNHLAIGQEFVKTLEPVFPEGYVEEDDQKIVDATIAEQALRAFNERFGANPQSARMQAEVENTLRELSVDPKRAEQINQVRSAIGSIDPAIAAVTRNTSTTGRMDFLTDVNQRVVSQAFRKVGRKEADLQTVQSDMEKAKETAKSREEKTQSVASILGGGMRGTTQGTQYATNGNLAKPVFVN